MSIVIKVSLGNIMISFDDWDDGGFDDDGNFTQEAKEFAVNHMMEFVDDFGNKLDGLIGEKVLVNESGPDFHELNANLKEISFDSYDYACLYISINKEIDLAFQFAKRSKFPKNTDRTDRSSFLLIYQHLYQHQTRFLQIFWD